MKPQDDLVHRICEWNNARYAQEFSKDLAISLLAEELLEFIKAKEEVDKLDALVDMVYIAIGGMWKMGLSTEQVRKAIIIVCDSNDTKAVKKTASHIKANVDKGPDYVRPEARLQELLNERCPF